MSVLGVEPIARAVLSQLEQRLPAKIALLQPTFPTSLPMPVPREYLYGHQRNFKLGYPSLRVLPRPSRTRAQDVAGRWIDQEHSVDVALFVAVGQEDDLEILLPRYARCCVEVLLEAIKASAFEPYDLVMADELIDYEPIAQLRGGLFARAVFLPARFVRRGAEERHAPGDEGDPVLKLEQTFSIANFVDGGAEFGIAAFAAALPARAVVLGARFNVTTGFTGTGVTSATAEVNLEPITANSGPLASKPDATSANVRIAGDYGSAYNTGSLEVVTAATTPRVRIVDTSAGADFTRFTAGTVTVTIYYQQAPA